MNQLLAPLSREIVAGFNLLSLIGFALMAVGLSQSRQGRSRRGVAIALMGIGTVLVFGGLYLVQHPR